MNSINKKRLDKLTPYLLISPAALILFLLIFLPFGILILFSFHPDAPHSEHIWTLENYRFVFLNNTLFYKVFFRTVLMAISTVSMSLVICFPIAYYIAKVAKKEHKLFLVLLVIAPNMVSGFIIILSWVVFIGDYGVLYQALKFLKIIEEPLQILYTSKAVAIGLVYRSTLWMLCKNCNRYRLYINFSSVLRIIYCSQVYGGENRFDVCTARF